MSRRRSTDSKQMRRQWALVRLLSMAGRSFSVKQLADQLCVSKSTIERDLATIGELFPLLEETVGKQKRRFRIAARPRELDAVRPFGTMQLLALYVALEMMRPLAGTPFYDDLKEVVQTVRALLAEHHNGGLDRLVDVFRVEGAVPLNLGDVADLIDDLVDAIARQKVCDVRYRTRGKTKSAKLQIEPTRLVLRNNRLEVDSGSPRAHRQRSLDIRDIEEIVAGSSRRER